MLGFNNKGDNEKQQKLVNFLDACSFIESYSPELRCGLAFAVLVLSLLFNLFDSFFLALAASILCGQIVFDLLCMFTIDRQYDVIYKELKYPLVVKEVNINKEDELANVNNDNPKIPGIDLVYEVKQKSDIKFAVAFQVDEKHYKILTSVGCNEKAKAHKKITSEILMSSFSGLKKDLIYSNKCLVVNVIKLKRDVEDLEIVSNEDIDDTLIVTECVYYPYIK